MVCFQPTSIISGAVGSSAREWVTQPSRARPRACLTDPPAPGGGRGGSNLRRPENLVAGKRLLTSLPASATCGKSSRPDKNWGGVGRGTRLLVDSQVAAGLDALRVGLPSAIRKILARMATVRSVSRTGLARNHRGHPPPPIDV